MNLDDGEIEIQVFGETFTLQPTLGALQKLDRRFGSLRNAIEQCSALSLASLVDVICIGAGLEKKEARRVPDLVFNEGVVNVAGQVTEYLAKLLDPSGKGQESGDEGKS